VKIGVPREIKNHEYRVAITPLGVRELTSRGHEVAIETAAGVGSAISDEEYAAAGAAIVPDAGSAWGTDGGIDLVLKVKEPVPGEYDRMREGQLLFTYLHLAADRPLTEELLRRKVTAVAYETVTGATGGLPLLYPMSEVAGCLAPQVGAHCLMKASGGRGVLLGGVGGVAELGARRSGLLVREARAGACAALDGHLMPCTYQRLHRAGGGRNAELLWFDLLGNTDSHIQLLLAGARLHADPTAAKRSKVAAVSALA